MTVESRIEEFIVSLQERHLADLTTSEFARALRALSSCYVERRGKLGSGGALDSAGKRAAFALFYGPLHFIVVREIVRALPPLPGNLESLLDLGCGTGTAGAAWAIVDSIPRITGIDRNAWAVEEADRTYRTLGLHGRATRGDVARAAIRATRGSAILAAYTINELTDEARQIVLAKLLVAHARGARVLIVEPIARTTTPWWDEWARRVAAEGGRADEWRFPVAIPDRLRALAKAARLDPRELTARSLWMGMG